MQYYKCMMVRSTLWIVTEYIDGVSVQQMVRARRHETRTLMMPSRCRWNATVACPKMP
jgi:hypothetical protein